jgi:hypothetical protein
MPDESLAIDKAICAFQGRIHFRVYMKGKPYKYGIKIFKLCEAKRGMSVIWNYMLAHVPQNQTITAVSMW